MNKKTILKFNSIKPVRPASWLALAILTVGAFGNSVQAQTAWFTENFDSLKAAENLTVGGKVASVGTTGFATGASSGGALRIWKTTTANSTATSVRWALSDNPLYSFPRSSGYITFSVQQTPGVTPSSSSYMTFRLGANDANTMNSQQSGWFEVRFVNLAFTASPASATANNLRVYQGQNGSGGNGPSVADKSINYVDSAVKIEIWYNNTGASINYTRPDNGATASLASRTFVVYAGSVLITPSANGTSIPSTTVNTIDAKTSPPIAPAVTADTIGKIGFVVGSSQTADFIIDNLYAADAAPGAAATPTVTSSTASQQAGYPYSYTIQSSGLTAPVTFSTTTDSTLTTLGLSLNPTTGVIAGTIPVGATTSVLNSINLTATGTGGATATGTLGLTITAPPAVVPTITSADTASGISGKAFTPYQISTRSTTPPSTPTSYAIVTGTLPAGLSLTANGAITGTPTATGTTVVTYTATNPYGTSNIETLTITIDPEPVSIWNNTGTDWDTASSWVGGLTPSIATPGSPTDLVQFGNMGASSNTVNLAATRGAAQVTFAEGANAYTFTGTGRLTIGTGGMVNNSTAPQTFNLGVDVGNVSPATWQSVADGSLVFNNGINLSVTSTSRVLQVAGAGNFTVNGAIANGGTALTSSITVTSTGTTTLTGDNTYDGLTTMNAATGTLTLSGNNSGAAGGVTLTTGTLNINNANALGSGLVTLTAGTINNTSGAAIVNAGNNAVTWGGNLAYGTANNTSLNSLNLGSGVVTTSTSRALTFAGTGNTLTMGALNITAPTSTGRVITVDGAGNTLNMGGLTLTANPSQAVTVELAGTANIGVTGPILNSSVTTAFANGVKVSATGTTTFSGVNAYSGSTAVAKSANLSIPSGGSLANCGPIVVAGTGTTAGNAANLNLAGAAGVVQVGQNGYVRGYTSGSTTTLGTITSLQVQNGGTVEVAVALGSTWTTDGTIDFAAGSKVSVTGTPVSGQTYTLMTATTDITGTPTLAATPNVAGWGLRVTGKSLYLEEVGIITIGSGASETYSTDNFITGSNPMTKRGSGTLILNAPNDYTGGTILEAGTLQIENSSALGTGAVMFKGGTLKSTVDLDLGKLVESTTSLSAGFQAVYGGTGGRLQYTTGQPTTINGPVTLDVGDGTMTMGTLIGNSSSSSLVTKIGAGTVKLMGGSTKLVDMAPNGNASSVLGGWRIQEGTVWFAPSANNGAGNGPIILAGGNAKFTKLQNSNGTYTGFEVPSDLTVESNGLVQFDPDPVTLLGQNNLGFKNLSIGNNTLEVATATTSTVAGQDLPSVNFKSATLRGSATLKNPVNLDLNLQAVSGTGGLTKTGLGTLYLSDQPNQAAAFAALTGTAVESINVEYAGSGYPVAPTVTVVPVNGGSGAEATAMIDSDGRVTSIRVTAPGSGYSSTPRVQIDPPPTVATANSYTGETTVEQGKLNLSGSYDSSVIVKSGAALQLDWLAPAQAKCSIDGISATSTTITETTASYAYVKNLYLTKSVGGYEPNTTFEFDLPAPVRVDGTGTATGTAPYVLAAARASATVDSNGFISALSIVSGRGGSGYAITPMVTIPAPTNPTVVATTTGSINFESGAKLALNIASPTSASYTLITADQGITGTPSLETAIPGYALTKSSDGKSLLLDLIDTTKPVITLIGASLVNVDYGSIYTDLGATVDDNKDARRSINGVGSVNTSASGSYTITFNTTDAAGNVADTVTRTVVVGAAPVTDGYALYLSSNGVPAGTAFNAKVNGVTVGLAYAFGSTNGSPRNNGVTAVPVMNGNQLTYTFDVREDFFDVNFPSRTVTFQTSTDLVTWTTPVAVSAGTGTTPSGFLKKQVQVTGAGKLFIRVNVTR